MAGKQLGTLAGLFAIAFGLTWLLSAPRGSQQAGELTAPAANRSVPRRGHRETPRPAVPAVKLVAPTLTVAQRLIADDPQTGPVTVTMIERTVFDLTDSRLRAGMAQTEPKLPRDCFPGDPLPGPVDWQVSVVVEPRQVTVSDYRVTSTNIGPSVVACLEDYFAGEATREAPEGITLRATETVFARSDRYLVSGREARARLEAQGLDPSRPDTW